jgi:hypothetical protein
VSGARTPAPELAGLLRPDLILLNDDDLGYALIRFDPRSLATLTSSIEAFADPLARAVCWSAVIDMTQRAELSLPAFTAMLAPVAIRPGSSPSFLHGVGIRHPCPAPSLGPGTADKGGDGGGSAQSGQMPNVGVYQIGPRPALSN